MRLSLRPLALSALFVLGLAPPTVGCAEERAPINRVQANALAKSFFVGELATPKDDPEFYMRTTMVDVDPGAGSDGLFTSSDAQPVTRVRFEITEGMLIARLGYELVEDTQVKGLARTENGQIVAAYTIEDHFDIRRAYDDTTGEESNVIEENDVDRPWYEREYFRVDWSRNLITDAYDLDALSQLGIYYGVKWDPVAYYVADPNSPDAPVFDPERGYFDITNKAYAAPQIIHDEWWGDYPACWLYGNFPVVNCNPSEVTLRQAFLKVTDTDYEPLEFDGTKMDMFGYFTWDRFGYDRRYGVADARWHRFATRWNMFERSHAEPVVLCHREETTPIGADPHRDDDQNGTEDECEAVGRGSRCDAVVGECTLPFRDRKVRTIAWHVSPDFPEELFDSTNEALTMWSESIRVALVAGRLAECRRTGESGCEATMGWPARYSDDGSWSPAVGNGSPAEVPHAFVLCHNPVDPAKGDELAHCGPAGTAPRLGDLRYNFLALINDFEWMAPWGIMMDAEDPLTGEKIAGSVNQWGATLDRAASTLVDLVQLLNGEIAPDAFIEGEQVDDWIAANQLGGTAERSHALSKSELASRKGALDPQVLATILDGMPSGNGKDGKPLPAVQKHKARLDALSTAGRLGPGNAVLTDRLERLRGSSIESAMVTPEVAQLAGYDPTAAIPDEAKKRASPFGRLNPTLRRENERTMRVARANKHSCRVEAPEPDYLLGLAKELASKYPPPDLNDPAAVQKHREDLYLWARQNYNRGVVAHELGHSMGLRHNFAASWDSLNYAPQYWQLRTHNNEVTAECDEGNTDGASCVGPRWKDPISDEEIDGVIGRYATTSVMDYPGDSSQDMLLPGIYDRAAVRFGYGGVVDVWNEDGVRVDGTGALQKKAYRQTAFTVGAGLFGVYYFPTPEDGDVFYHYSQYQKLFTLISDCTDSDAPDAILGKKCNAPAMDVADYRDMKDFTAYPDYADFSWASQPNAVDPAGRVRRGYHFSSDEYADSGNVPSFTDDAGADAYEQIRFLESGYENRYILDSFRRGRTMFNSADVLARIQYRYLDPIQYISKTFAFGAILDGDPANPSADLFDDGYYGPLGLGASVAFDLFARIVTRPEPGFYCPSDNPDCYGIAQPYGVEAPIYSAEPGALPKVFPDFYDFELGLTEGRYVHNDFDYSQGYFWSDYQSQVGSYYEKTWATYYLAEAFDSFISNSKEDFTDGRYKNVNFMTIYPEQTRRLFASLLTGDYEAFAPWVDSPPNDGTPPRAPRCTPTGTLSRRPRAPWTRAWSTRTTPGTSSSTPWSGPPRISPPTGPRPGSTTRASPPSAASRQAGRPKRPSPSRTPRAASPTAPTPRGPRSCSAPRVRRGSRRECSPGPTSSPRWRTSSRWTPTATSC
jgi:hypothetical protein